MFGLPTEDDGSRNDALLGQTMVPSTHYQHDFDALRVGRVAAFIVTKVGARLFPAGVGVGFGQLPIDNPQI
jgi:hypothetical protein